MELQKIFEQIYAKDSMRFPEMLIDYWGVNIYSDRKFECKLYEDNTGVEAIHQDFIEKIRNCDVISKVFYVENSADSSSYRVDIALKNRTENNMLRLYETIKSESVFIKEPMDEVLKLSSMKVSELSEFKYASMYFAGFVYDQAVKAIKFHFITRNIDNNSYDNKYYLEYLTHSGIKGIEECCCHIRRYLEQSGGNLWMAGLDYFDDASAKYKVFIKDVSLDILHQIDQDIGQLRKPSDQDRKRMHQELKMFCEWLALNRDMYLYGIAICCDNHENISFNFYCQGMLAG